MFNSYKYLKTQTNRGVTLGGKHSLVNPVQLVSQYIKHLSKSFQVNVK